VTHVKNRPAKNALKIRNCVTCKKYSVLETIIKELIETKTEEEMDELSCSDIDSFDFFFFFVVFEFWFDDYVEDPSDEKMN
jgi:hypothetical protein